MYGRMFAILSAMLVSAVAGAWPKILEKEDCSVSRGMVDLYRTEDRIYVGLPLMLILIPTGVIGALLIYGI